MYFSPNLNVYVNMHIIVQVCSMPIDVVDNLLFSQNLPGWEDIQAANANMGSELLLDNTVTNART